MIGDEMIGNCFFTVGIIKAKNNKNYVKAKINTDYKKITKLFILSSELI
jgi:hypothetical protein